MNISSSEGGRKNQQWAKELVVGEEVGGACAWWPLVKQQTSLSAESGSECRENVGLDGGRKD